MCAWCQKVGIKRYSLSMGSEVKSFCSEKCFAACRRAYFKRNKVSRLRGAPRGLPPCAHAPRSLQSKLRPFPFCTFTICFVRFLPLSCPTFWNKESPSNV